MEDTMDLGRIDPDSALAAFISDMEGRDGELERKAFRYGVEALKEAAGKDGQ